MRRPYDLELAAKEKTPLKREQPGSEPEQKEVLKAAAAVVAKPAAVPQETQSKLLKS